MRMGVFMRIRLGYACISKTLDYLTPSSPYTYTEYLEKRSVKKLDSVIVSNLKALHELILYNIKNNVHFFRVSSKLIPLATKNDVVFNYKDPYRIYYQQIGKLILESKMRVDFHPDQFCVLNSTKKEVVSNTLEILKYHYNILDYLGVKDKILVIHVGGNTFGKEKSISRFINNFNRLPSYLKKCIAIENDDKIFNIKDCLKISQKLDIPVVLDYHHFRCNNEQEKLEDVMKDILASWHNKTPKIHFSSPKNNTKKDFRSHHDYIDVDSFIKFIDIIKGVECDIDIMIEAKAKDEALFRLVRELKYKTDFIFMDETSFIV